MPGTGGRVMLVVVVIASLRTHATAGDVPPPQLVLPLLTTLALGRSVVDLHLGGGRGSVATLVSQGKVSFLPSNLTIPDLYAVDVADRDAPRFAAPIDRDTYLRLNLLPARFSDGKALSVIYDTETLPALGDNRRLLRLELKLKF